MFGPYRSIIRPYHVSLNGQKRSWPPSASQHVLPQPESRSVTDVDVRAATDLGGLRGRFTLIPIIGGKNESRCCLRDLWLRRGDAPRSLRFGRDDRKARAKIFVHPCVIATEVEGSCVVCGARPAIPQACAEGSPSCPTIRGKNESRCCLRELWLRRGDAPRSLRFGRDDTRSGIPRAAATRGNDKSGARVPIPGTCTGMSVLICAAL